MERYIKYNIGDIMLAVSNFSLEDVYGRKFNYHIGDHFIIMSIMDVKDYNYVEFNFNTNDSVFKWSFTPKELKELPEYIVHKSEYLKRIRKQKIKILNEIA